jgi:AraC-like DNA-binding protein
MFLKYITLISGFNYLLFSIVLLFKKTHARRDSLVLGFLFLIMALYSLLLFIYNSALFEGNYSILAYYFPVEYVLIALMGPSVFFYINAILNRPFHPRLWKTWLHILPLIPSVFYNCYFLSLTKLQRVSILVHSHDSYSWIETTLNGFFYIQMTVYLFVSYVIIRKQLKISTKVLKGFVLIDISWLNTLMLIDLFIMFISAPLFFYLANERASNIIAQLAMDIQLIYIFFKSIWQTGIFPVEKVAVVKSKEPVLKIADELAGDYLKILIEYIEGKKPYLNENCNLQSVSEQTGISVHHLSNLLNQRFDKNFSDFINEYRIAEAKKILSSKQSEKITLESIGYECGFGSKSSFNNAFKKLTNLTPSQFRQQFKS